MIETGRQIYDVVSAGVKHSIGYTPHCGEGASLTVTFIFNVPTDMQT